MRKRKTPRTLHKRLYTADLVRLAGDDDAPATYAATLSSEALVERSFGLEELVHTDDAVDLSRGERGYPLLWNHDQSRPIGRVRDVRLDGGRLRGNLHFSPHTQVGREVEADVRGGFLDGVSVGYQVDPKSLKTVKGTRTVKVGRWTPYEFSLVSVPADIGAAIGRATTEGRDMDEETTTIEREAEIRAEERTRQNDVRAMFAPYLSRGPRFAKLLDEELRGERSRGEISERLLAELGRDLEPAGDDYRQGDRGGFNTGADRRGVFTPGRDELDKIRSGVTSALLMRGGFAAELPKDYRAEENPWADWTLGELARLFAPTDLPGQRFETRGEMIGALLTRATPSHGTGDFANILLSISTKSMLRGWTESAENWRPWVRVGSLPDYKQAARVNLSNFDALTVVPEGADIPYGDMSDVRENIQIVKYARRFSHTREMVMNDDLDAFQRIPTRMGRAAARIPGDLAYAHLTGNTVLNQDATAIFDATHSNQVASSGGPPTVTTVSAARTAMALQTDPSGATLGIQLTYLLVPLELEDQTRVLAGSEFDPNATAGVFAPNSQRGRFEVIADHRLSTDDAAKWYATGNPAVDDTVEVAFLGGRDRPVVERETVFSNDATAYKVRLEVGSAPLDYRALYYNVGA